MSWDSAFKAFTSLFTISPELAVGGLTLVWLLLSYWYRYVQVGRKISLPDVILQGFVLKKEAPGDISLKVIIEEAALPKSGAESGSSDWKVGELIYLYWVLKAHGLIVKVASALLLVAIAAVGAMNLAQPASGISLFQVMETVSLLFGSFGFLLLLLSFLKVWGSINKLPLDEFSQQRGWQVILLSW